MKSFKIITDTDIGVSCKEFENPYIRNGARGIVLREDGKIAVFNKQKENVYKLPGGGIDKGEKPQEAFKRECLEETGCIVEIEKEIGIIEEHKSLNNFKQISYVYVAKVIEDTKKLNITEKEKKEGARLLWKKPEEALKLIRNCFDKIKDSPVDKDEDVYSSRFIVLRDRLILEKYLEENNI